MEDATEKIEGGKKRELGKLHDEKLNNKPSMYSGLGYYVAEFFINKIHSVCVEFESSDL